MEKQLIKQCVSFLALLLFVGIPQIFAQNYEWVESGGGKEWDMSFAVAYDLSGNAIITGQFQDTSYFGSVTLIGPGAFVVKYDASGNVLWGEVIPNSYGQAVATDADGNIFVTGYYYHSTQAGSIPLPHVGGNDIFLVKYNLSGNVEWAKSLATGNHDEGNSVKTDLSGNVYLTGYYDDAGSFGAAPYAFLSKFASNGNEIWTVGADGGLSRGYELKLDLFGNIYFRGEASGTVNFGSHSSTSSHFITIFDEKGNNSQGFDFPGFGRSFDIDVAGNVYITGSYFENETLVFDSIISPPADGQDIFYAKRTSSGDWEWAKFATGPHEDITFGLVAANDGNFWMAGHFTGTLTFQDSIILDESGGPNSFIAAFNTHGILRWAKSNTSTSIAGSSQSTGIDFNEVNSDLFWTGWFTFEYEFDSNVVESEGTFDTYLAKLHDTPPPPTITVDFSHTKGCKGRSVQFTDESQIDGITNIVSWSWNFGDNNSSSQDQNPIHTFDSTGVYLVKLIVTDNLDNSDSLIKEITIHENPVADYSFTIDSQNVTFEDKSTGATSWFWEFDDGSTSTHQNPFHHYEAQDLYVVCLTVENEFRCKDQTCKQVDLFITGISENSSLKWSIFPNPTTDQLVIEGDIGNNTVLTIKDISGRIILSENLNSDNKKKTISLSNFDRGIYFVSIGNGNEKSVKKLILK